VTVTKPAQGTQNWHNYTDPLFDEHNADNVRIGVLETAMTSVREAPLSLTDPRVGAVLDGTGNQASAVATAIGLLPAAGGHIYQPPGILRTGAITFDRPVRWEGAGDQASTIQAASGFTGTVMTIGSAAPFSRISDVAITGGGSATKLLVVASARTRLDHLHLTGQDGTTGAAIHFDGVSSGASAHAGQVSDVRIIDCDGYGVLLQGFSYDNEFTNLWIGSCNVGIRYENTNGVFTNTHVWGCIGNGVELRDGNHLFSNCYVETCGGSGFNLFNAARVRLSNSNIWKNQGQGVSLSGTSHRFSAVGCLIYDNGGNGVQGADSLYGQVIGCTFYDDTGSAQTQDRPVVTTGTSDSWIVVGNTMRVADHATGGASLVGTANRFVGNDGLADYPATAGAVTGQVNLDDYATSSTAGTGLNSAIAALPSTGGTILVPAGEWTVNTAALVSKNGLIFRGISPSASKLVFNGSTVPVAIKNADTTQRYVTIQDLSIISSVDGAGTAIDAAYFVNSQFHRLRIGSVGSAPNRGIDFNTVGTYYNTVRDCRITVAGSGSRCLSFDTIANSNWVDNVRLLGDADTVGVYVNAHANTIARVDCETTMAIGVQVEPTGNDCHLISPYLEQVDVGIQLASGVEAFTCTGGVIIDCDVNNIVDNGAKDPAFINTRLQYEPYTSMTARSPAFPQSYPIQTAQVQPQDHSLISWSSDPTLQNTSTVLTAGTIYLTKVYVRNRVTLNNIYWWVGAAGVTATAGQNEVGLYTSAGTRVVAANVDAAITSTGLKTTAVTPTTLAAGWYWVAGVFNAATLPGLMRGNAGAGITTAMNIGLTASFLRYATNATSQTTLPSSITPASNAATAFAGPWVAIG
jgi:hypothetical protein